MLIFDVVLFCFCCVLFESRYIHNIRFYEELTVINVYKLTSDNEFLVRIFDCWEAGKIFSNQ